MPGVHRVLIVEPHAPTGEYLARAVAEAGFEPIGCTPRAAWETWAARKPELVVIAADAPDAAALTHRMREADPRVLVVVTDKEHLGKALGLKACIPIKAKAYVS